MFKMNSKTIFIRHNMLLSQILKQCIVTCIRKYQAPQLMEIGKIEAPKSEQYNAGQLFLHKHFGYRGLIVLPWTGQVFDRDMHENSEYTNYKMVCIDDKQVRFYIKNYYQVFIDSRDRPYIKTLNEVSTGVAGTPNRYSKLLHYAPGLDYAAHEDILPYKSTEQVPIKHEMVNDFFYCRPGNNIQPREILQATMMKNSNAMKIDVHKETTENVKIVAIPSYLGCQKIGGLTLYSWRYTIRIENFTGSSIRLISQKWRISNLKGKMEEVCGEGVMGEEVILDHSLPVFQYNSHINLLTPSGHMTGTFKMEKQDQTKFSCSIPKIFLRSRRGLEEMPCWS